MSVTDRRPASPAAPARRAPANEWGVYDPSVAGIQALFARLGADDPEDEAPPPRRTRRASTARQKATDDTSGVGLAIAEAIARAQQQRSPAPAAIVVATPSQTAPPAVAAAPPRPATRRAPTAMWVRSVSVAPTLDLPRDEVLGIFADLRIPAPVALVQYARGARIGTIRVIEP